jgi:transposase-like protein
MGRRVINAIEAAFPHAVRIRCWFHRVSNLRAKLANDTAPEVMAEIRSIRDATKSAYCARNSESIRQKPEKRRRTHQPRNRCRTSSHHPFTDESGLDCLMRLDTT